MNKKNGLVTTKILIVTIICTLAFVSIFSQTVQATTIPRGGLVGEWKFENNVLDTSSKYNNGINNGATFVPGMIGEALSFDGVSNTVTVPDSPTLNFGSTGNFTISLWMESTQSSGAGMLVTKRSNNDGVYQGYSIEDFAGTLVGRVRDGSGHDVTVSSTSNVNDGKFHHIVFEVNRATQASKLYVDDVLQARKSISSVGSIDSSLDLLFGGQASPRTPIDFYSGILDQVRIYHRALGSAGINELFLER